MIEPENIESSIVHFSDRLRKEITRTPEHIITYTDGTEHIIPGQVTTEYYGISPEGNGVLRRQIIQVDGGEDIFVSTTYSEQRDMPELGGEWETRPVTNLPAQLPEK